MTTSARWGWIVASLATTGGVLVLAFVLSFSSQGGGFYERHFVWLFWVYVAVATMPTTSASISATATLTQNSQTKWRS